MKTQRIEQYARTGSFARALSTVVIGLLAVGAMMFAQPLFAQKVGGTLTLTYDSSSHYQSVEWTLSRNNSGDSFTAIGGIDYLYSNFPVLCNPCSSSVDVNGVAVGYDSFLGGSAVTSSSSTQSVFPSLDWGPFFAAPPVSQFWITGNPIPITGPGTYTTPFTFTGSLCGQVASHPYSCDVGEANLTGSGQVIVHIAKNTTMGYLYTTQATYYFVP